MASVVPLVVFKNGQYELHEPSMQWLASHKGEFAVMACAGKFRTGKSFLLNRFTQCKPGLGFGVGETVQACTRGIWMYKNFMSEDAGTPLLVLDTEGIDALDAENEHDVRIFALSVLISSIFVYNSMSHLDEAAVQTLSLMTKVTQAIGEETHSPTLYWVLRDFALQLVDAKGQTITHAQYLNQALDCPATASKCATREAIKQVFKERHLVTLPRPHKGENMQKLEHQALNSKFEKFLATFRSHVCKNAKPFSASGVPLTGNVYVEFLRNIILEVNTENSIPKIEDAWTLLSRVQHIDKEIEARRILFETAFSECIPDVEHNVFNYVKRLCSQHCQSLIFMPPQPNVESMTDRLTDDVFNHCRAIGKVFTVEKVAYGFVNDFLVRAGFKNIAHDPSVLMEFYKVPFPDEATRLKAFEIFPKVLIESTTLQDALSTAEKKGKERHHLELEETKLKLQHTEECLADVSKRSWNADTFTEMTRDDACTQTDMMSDDSNTCDAAILVDAEKKIVELESQLSVSLGKVSLAEEKIKHNELQNKKMQSIYEENIEDIRSQTIERLALAQREKEDAVAEAKQCIEQRKVLQEEYDKLHHSLREAQERTVDLHRSTLDELRRRDSEGRDIAEKQRLEWSSLRVQAEMTSQENRCLKRRLDEFLEIEQESKRLRNNYKHLEVEHAKDETAKELLQQQLQAIRNENESLRRNISEIESRLAVSEASSKLDTCRRSFL
jgi:hypothetical protein